MRIAIVHSFYRSEIPSGENLAVQMQAKALSEAGHDVVLVATGTDDRHQSALYALRAALRVALNQGDNPLDALEKEKPDVVHIHNLFPNWTSSWIPRVQRPTVATFHNYRPYCSAGTLSREGDDCFLCPTRGSHNAIRHRCYRQSAMATIPLAVATRKSTPPQLVSNVRGAVFLSRRSKTVFEQLGPVPENSAVIPNFTLPSTQRGSSDRAKLKRSGYVFVGRLSSEKGILELIENWTLPETLTVVGSGPLEARCRELALGRSVAFAGHRSNSEVRAFLASAKALIFPSTWQETAPALSYIEALAEGTPTISLKGSAVADDVAEHRTGEVLVSIANLPKILRKIDSYDAKYQVNALSRFQEGFSQESWTAQIVALYQNVLSGWG